MFLEFTVGSVVIIEYQVSSIKDQTLIFIPRLKLPDHEGSCENIEIGAHGLVYTGEYLSVGYVKENPNEGAMQIEVEGRFQYRKEDNVE